MPAKLSGLRSEYLAFIFFFKLLNYFAWKLKYSLNFYLFIPCEFLLPCGSWEPLGRHTDSIIINCRTHSCTRGGVLSFSFQPPPHPIKPIHLHFYWATLWLAVSVVIQVITDTPITTPQSENQIWEEKHRIWVGDSMYAWWFSPD